MTLLLDQMKGRVDHQCIVSGALRKEGCSVSMRASPKERVAIDLDHPKAPIDANTTRCDFLLFAELQAPTTWAAAFELKRGGFDAPKVAAQLQGGAALAERLTPSGHEVQFRAVVVSGKFPKAERDRLKRQTVRFQGTDHDLTHRKCGVPLREVFAS